MLCTVRHHFPPHRHMLFDILFAIANLVFPQHRTRMWVCFGSFAGVGLRNNGFLWPDNCYLLPCFAGRCWEAGRTCVYQFGQWSGGSTRIECWGSTVAYHLMQLAMWHPWLNPQSRVRSGQSWRNEHDSNTNLLPSFSLSVVAACTLQKIWLSPLLLGLEGQESCRHEPS